MATLPLGTLRIKVKDEKTYEKTSSGWKKSNKSYLQALDAIRLFKAHSALDFLIDQKDPTFFKGFITKHSEIRGARIAVLPNGKKLEKAFSLFSPHLTIHDQQSHDHWDVLYQNKSGSYAYVYTIDKRLRARQQKYRKVDEFEKKYPILLKSVTKALEDKTDYMAVPMYTLLTTYMRVGNEIYYKLHKHKGLLTLMKKDICIQKNQVTFDYIGKDGVPISITKEYPLLYLKRLNELLKNCKQNDFVFKNPHTSHLLTEDQFQQAFQEYCGTTFYPHIVRSYYATHQVKEFLKNTKTATKAQVKEFLLRVAGALGHRHFVKKTNVWKESYNTTIHSYVPAAYVEKLWKICE